MSRKFSKGLLVLSGVLALGAVGLASCGETRPTETESIYNSITITNKSAFESLVAEGKAVDLELVVDPEANIPELLMQDKIQITSDHPEIAKAEGLTITPLAEGTAKITVKLETRTDTVDVTVTPKPVQEKMTIAKIIKDYSSEVMGDTEKKEADRTRFSFEAVVVANTKDQDIVFYDGANYINGYTKKKAFKDLVPGKQYLIEDAFLAAHYGQFQIKDGATFTEVEKTITEDTKKEYGKAELDKYVNDATVTFATADDYYEADAAIIKNAEFISKKYDYGMKYVFMSNGHKIEARYDVEGHNWDTIKEGDICTLEGIIKGYNSGSSKFYLFADKDAVITTAAADRTFTVTVPEDVTADKTEGKIGDVVTLTYEGTLELRLNDKKVTPEADGKTYKITIGTTNVITLVDLPVIEGAINVDLKEIPSKDNYDSATHSYKGVKATGADVLICPVSKVFIHNGADDQYPGDYLTRGIKLGSSKEGGKVTVKILGKKVITDLTILGGSYGNDATVLKITVNGETLEIKDLDKDPAKLHTVTFAGAAAVSEFTLETIGKEQRAIISEIKIA